MAPVTLCPAAWVLLWRAAALLAQARRADRQQRFAADLASIKAASAGSGSGVFGVGRSAAESEQAIGSGWLALHGGFGTNRSLEKEYLRLTSVPKAEDVRPPEVCPYGARGVCWGCRVLACARRCCVCVGKSAHVSAPGLTTAG